MSDLRTLFTPHEEVKERWDTAQRPMGTLEVERIYKVRQRGVARVRGAIKPFVGPAAQRGLDEALRLAVGLGVSSPVKHTVRRQALGRG